MTKKIWSSCLSFFLCVTLILTGGISFHKGVHANADLTIPNGGFELASADGGIPSWEQTFGTEGFSLDTSEVYGGQQSLKLEDASSTGSIGMLSSKVPVSGGQSYKASTKLKLIQGEIFLYLYFYNSTGTKIGESRNTSYTLDEWVTLSVVGAAPPGTTSAAVMFYSGVGPVSTAYMDDVALEVTFSGPVDLGEVVGTIISQGVAFGNGVNGENELYFATNGKPATFYAVNAETMEVVHSEPLPGLDVVWAITVGSDGLVYFSGTTNYRIYQYDPIQKKISNLANNRTYNAWIWDMEASSDGKVYGSTYPHARLFEFDLTTKASTWVNFNKSKEVTTEQYARGIGVTDTHVYVGIGTKAHLFKMDRVTNEVTEVIVPNRGNPGTSISKAWIYGGKLLVRSGGSRLFVLDEATHEVIRGVNNENYIDFQYAISPPSPLDENKIYYKYEDALYSYDLQTDVIEEVVRDAKLPLTAMRGFDWITLKHGPKAGSAALVGYTEFGEMITYDPLDHFVKVTYPQVKQQGVAIQSLESGPNGRLYLGGYQGGMSIYNPWTDEIEYSQPQLQQSEGIGFLNQEAFFGTYSGAKIYRFDITQPVDYGHGPGNNPGLAFDVEGEQDRPFAFASGGGKLFLGTVPYYGVLGGALAVYDQSTNNWQVHRNVVQDQSIMGLVYHEGKVFGSTSVYGGLGSEPTADVAKMFVWDAVTGEKLQEFTPQIPGIDQAPRAIGQLSIGPDGKLWGAAQGTIFVMEPDTLEIERARMIYPSDWDVSHYWRPIYLRWGADGMLYTTLDRKLTVVDPATLDSYILDSTALMTFGEDGNLYYAKGSHLYRIQVPGSDKQIVSMQTEGTDSGYTARMQLHDAKGVSGGKLIFRFDAERFEVEGVTLTGGLADRKVNYDKGRDGKLVVNIVPSDKGGILTGTEAVLQLDMKLRDGTERPSVTSLTLDAESEFTSKADEVKYPILSEIVRWIGLEE
jgi:hypothetical protein